MDIFKFAMEKEQFSEDYYRRLADKTRDPGLKHIFTMLANEETKHYRIIQKMQSEVVTEVTQTPVLRNAREVFEKMRESAGTINLDAGEVALYQKARDIEQQSIDFYLEKAGSVDVPSQKTLFKKLAAEEQKHFRLLDAICTFVARPQWFLENAEMYRFDDYANGVL